MGILQFLRIFWARRWILVVAVSASFLGAFIVTLLVSPRYEATARVMMNFTKPDPVTGELPNLKGAGPYFDQQMEMLKGEGVAGRVVERFGWLTDINRINAYQARSSTDTRDFRAWLGQQVTDNVKPKISGTVVEITYQAPTAEVARVGAEIVRDAYLEEALAKRRKDATGNADWYLKQADSARRAAEDAELKKAAYERESGIVMQGRDSDLESERLAALAGQVAAGSMMGVPQLGSGSAMQVAQLDAQIAEASKRLGPNHPEMQELRSRRAMMAQVAAQEAAAARAAASGAGNAEAVARALQAQKSRVLGERDKIERLRQLQAEVDLRRDQYRAAAARAAQYSQEAAASETGLESLGDVLTPRKPAFPNRPLILGGSIVLGFGLGLALSLLLELLNRRVRGVEDLHLSSEIRCIGVVEQPNAAGRLTLRQKIRRLLPRRAGAVA